MIERPEQKCKYASKVNFYLFLNTLEMEKFVLKAAREEKKELFIMTNGCLPLSSVYANQFKIFINRYFQLNSEYQKLLENSLPSKAMRSCTFVLEMIILLIKNLITKSIIKVLKSNINRILF